MVATNGSDLCTKRRISAATRLQGMRRRRRAALHAAVIETLEPRMLMSMAAPTGLGVSVPASNISGTTVPVTLTWTNSNAPGTVAHTFLEAQEPGSSNWFTLQDMGTSTTATYTFSGSKAFAVDAAYALRVRVVGSDGAQASTSTSFDTPTWNVLDQSVQHMALTPDTDYDELSWDPGTWFDYWTIYERSADSPFPDQWLFTANTDPPNTNPYNANAYDLTGQDTAWFSTHDVAVQWGWETSNIPSGLPSTWGEFDQATTFTGVTPHSFGLDAPDNVAGTPDYVNEEYDLSWDAVSGATGYAIFNAADGQPMDVPTTAGTSASIPFGPYTFTNFSAHPNDPFGVPNTFMRNGYFYVQARGGSGGAYSGMSQLIDTSPAFAPATLDATAVNDGTAVSLVWENTAYNETGYEVWRKVGACGTYQKIQTLGADAITWTDTGDNGDSGTQIGPLKPAQTYYYKVVATRSDTALNSAETTDMITMPATSCWLCDLAGLVSDAVNQSSGPQNGTSSGSRAGGAVNTTIQGIRSLTSDLGDSIVFGDGDDSFGNGTASGGVPTFERYCDGTVVIALGPYKLFFAYDSTYHTYSGMTGNPFHLASTLVTGTTYAYTLSDDVGDAVTFTGDNAAGTGYFTGKTNASGLSQSVTSRDGSGRPLVITQDLGGGHAETLTYTWGTTGGAANHLTTIAYARDGGAAVETLTCAYYGTGATYGNSGDLRTVTHTTAAGGTTVAYVRYTKLADGTSRVASVTSGDNYDRLVQDQGGTLDSTDVSAYSDSQYTYDDAGRLTGLVSQGNGCSACTGGFGTTVLAYTTSAFVDGINTWSTKKVERQPGYNASDPTNPQNVTVTTYSNYLGQAILTVTEQTATGLKWLDFYRYDAYGNVLEHALPSAVAGFSEALEDLVGHAAPAANYIRDNDGLIEGTEWVSQGTGYYLQATYVAHGDHGDNAPTKHYQSYTAYTSHTAAGVTQYLPSDEVTFPTDVTSSPGTGSTGARVTHYDYTFATSGTNSTQQILSVATTLPTVSSGNNGPNAAVVSKVYNDAHGRPIWTLDADGYITYTAYDALTGAVLKTIQDVQYSSLSSGEQTSFTATGWSHHTTGLNLVTTFAIDSQGRTTKVTDPKGNLTYTVYNDAAHEVRTYPGWDATNKTTTGPITLSRQDTARGYSESLTYSWSGTGGNALPVDGSGVPTGGESLTSSYAHLQSLSRSYANTARQVVRSDAYFNLSGVTYSTSTYIGTANTNYYTTTYGYDGKGRLAETVSPTLTITVNTYDALGRSLGTYVGTDDVPTSNLNGMGSTNWEDFVYGVNASPTTIPAGTDMTLVNLNQYDYAGTGDSNLTQTTQYPTPSTGRTTEYLYDWRNRQISAKGGVTTTATPSGWTDTNLNSPGWTGTVVSDGATFLVTGGGTGLAGTADKLNFVRRSVTGNTTLIARVGDLTNTSGADQAGIMIRNSTASDAMFAAVLATPAGGLVFAWRTTTGGSMAAPVTVSGVSGPVWLKLVRSSDAFTASYSADGTSWTTIGSSQNISMSSGTLAGLAVTAGDNAKLSTARFDHVTAGGTTFATALTEGTSVHRPLTVQSLNNVGQVLTSSSYDGDGTDMVDADGDGSADGLSSAKLRGRSSVMYDEQGRAFRTTTYNVDQTYGTYSTSSANTLVSNLWFDLRGNIIASHTSGGPMSKSSFDGVGRTTASYVTDGGAVNNTSSAGTILTSWVDAATVNRDIVLSQTDYAYDANSNLVLTTSRERFHDNATNGTGVLLTIADTSGHAARVSYVANAYNAANRITATWTVGTNGGSAYSLPGNTPTAATDTLLLTLYGYNAAGDLETVTDPRGLVSKTYFDAVGRTTRTVANYVDGTPSIDSGLTTDQTTLYTYDGAGHILTLTADMPSGTHDQVTEYVYGGFGSGTLQSNELLRLVKYPSKTAGTASTSASEQNSFTYDALGELLTKVDQNGTLHTYTYDALGRRLIDAVTIAIGNPQNVSDSVVRIETTYGVFGRVASITSYDANNVCVSGIYSTYDGFGLLSEMQDVTSTDSLVESELYQTVEYVYDSAAHGNRLLSVTYTDDTEIDYTYGTSNSLNDVISRLEAIKQSGTTLEGYSYLGLSTIVKRAHPQTSVDLTYIKKSGESAGDAGDQYNGLDRFGRIVDQRYLNGSGADVDRYTYTYDRDSNRVTKTNTLSSALTEAYAYDGLNRLVDTHRNGAAYQAWGLDSAGNMATVTSGGVTLTRAHNDLNQLTDMDTNVSGTLSYDNNGNVTTDDHGNSLSYDAWNRMVGNGSVALTYDGLGRCTYNGTVYYYYGAGWQVVQEHATVDTHSTVVSYVWGAGYSDDLVLRDRDSNADGSLDERLYAMQDANMNVTGVLNTGGTVLERFVYDSYGRADVKNAGWSGTSDAYAWTRLHQGLEFNSTLGWYMNRNRVYSPTMMRFAQEEPSGAVSYVDGLNLYQGYGGNSINRVDPMGLYVEERTIGDTVYFHVYKQHYWVSTLFGYPREQFVRSFRANVNDMYGVEAARSLANVTDRGGTIHSASTGGLSAGKVAVAVAGMAIPGPEEVLAMGILAKIGPKVVRVLWKKGVGYVTAQGEKVAVQATIGQCCEYTKGFIKVLAEKGLKGERVALQAVETQSGKLANIPVYTDEFGAIATNGYHEAIRIESKVFDNLHPEGIPYTEWIKKFIVRDGFTLREAVTVVP